ncbi:hypothetical protein [Gracilibacillus lacisalsi]|uniref:hypothetical protein n=1 Tax=Gracilibacillus lacisalsi TaxID=393087 RepID=UPI000376E08F|nr:hypothetical protein [Gracilibacillus lacisalsi]
MVDIGKLKGNKKWGALEQLAKYFEENEDLLNLDGWFNAKRQVNINGIEKPFPYMVFITFGSILKFDYLVEPFEKVAWFLPFKYKGCSFAFSHEKFGLKILSYDDKSNHEIERDMLIQVIKMIKIADELLEPIATEQVEKGNITIENQFHKFNERYLFFRKKANEVFQNDNVPVINGEIGLASFLNNRSQRTKEGFYYGQAMLDAYFSFLEHLCVLLLPMNGYDRNVIAISNFMTANWIGKYKQIFNIDDL